MVYEVRQRPAPKVFRLDPCQLRKGSIVGPNAAIFIENDDRDGNALHNRADEVSRLSQLLLAPPKLVDIDQHNDQSLNPIFRGAVGTYPQQVPAALAILNLYLSSPKCIHHLQQDRFNVFNTELQTDLADGSSDISGAYIEKAMHRRSELADFKSLVSISKGMLTLFEQIAEVVSRLGEDQISLLQLFVDGLQFFIGALELFLGCFQFLIGALQFFICGLNLLIC